MLSILGTPKRLCDGLTRRGFLQLGGLATFGLGLGDALRLQAAPASRAGNFGKAKACILLFPYGSPPQHETFDPKPDAPAEIQGELKAIRSNVPGVLVGEGVPQVSQIMDRLCVVRSVTHPYAEHGVAYAVTGMPTYSPALETRPRDPQHWPFIGSIVDYLEEKRSGESTPPIPRNIGLPWLLNSKTDMNVSAGPYAAFLGQAYDPVWTDFDGPGLKIAPRYTECFSQHGHGGCGAHGHAVTRAANNARLQLLPVALGDSSGAKLLLITPAIGARTEFLAAPVSLELRTAGQQDRRDIRTGSAHQQRRRRLVAAAQQDHCIERVAANRLLDIHAHQVAPQHGGRP